MSNSRKLRIEDLISIPKEKEYNSDKKFDSIPKNQKDFGHKKRIKP